MIERRPVVKLDPRVVSKIAAGEMILRPFSVGKELLENALDAGAQAIEIVIGESADQLLQVSDDGIGMDRDDLLIALESHATSKLASEADLLNVKTLGFRGEALPSIGRVSKLELVSSTDETGEATKVIVEGGHQRLLEPAARPRGTTVRVEELFYNSPVRKRFLRAPSSEVRLLAKLVATYALAFPAISFRLSQRGMPILELPAVPDVAARVAQIHGPGFAEKILPLDHASPRGRISGYVGIPELARPGSQHQTLLVNGRWVSASWLGAALRQGFGDLIPAQRNPFALCFLEIDPSRVDVNVHPTKREVRFLDEGGLFGDVVRAVRGPILKLVPSWNLDPKDHGSGSTWGDAGLLIARDVDPSATPRLSGRDFAASDGSSALRLLYGDPRSEREAAGASLSTSHLPIDSLGSTSVGAVASDSTGSASGESPETLATAPLVTLWQLHQRYLLAQTRMGLVIIDQHAAHERVLYEVALAQLQETPAATQQLLFPVAIQLDPSEWSAFQEFREDLVRLGVDSEEFGQQTVLLRGVPALWNQNPEGFFRELLEEVAGAPSRGAEERMRQLAASFACRSAVKSGRTLTLGEMNSLVDQLFATKVPHGDPHGRPTFVQVSLADLDRRFGR